MTTPTHSHKAWTDKGGHVNAIGDGRGFRRDLEALAEGLGQALQQRTRQGTDGVVQLLEGGRIEGHQGRVDRIGLLGCWRCRLLCLLLPIPLSRAAVRPASLDAAHDGLVASRGWTTSALLNCRCRG
jgi:hypothetical protein